jgi:hypothetical protein
MTRNADVDHLLNEGRRICTSISGRISSEALRMQFCTTLARSDPRRTHLNQAFARAVERARQQNKLTIDADGSYWLRE